MSDETPIQCPTHGRTLYAACRECMAAVRAVIVEHERAVLRAAAEQVDRDVTATAPRVPPPDPGDVAVERELQDAMAKEIDRTMPETVAAALDAPPAAPPHHELVFALVLRAHAQPRPGEETQQFMPSFRAARREGFAFYAALQRLCERHGYALGAQSMLQHRVATHVEGESTRSRAEGL